LRLLNGSARSAPASVPTAGIFDRVRGDADRTRDPNQGQRRGMTRGLLASSSPLNTLRSASSSGTAPRQEKWLQLEERKNNKKISRRTPTDLYTVVLRFVGDCLRSRDVVKGEPASGHAVNRPLFRVVRWSHLVYAFAVKRVQNAHRRRVVRREQPSRLTRRTNRVRPPLQDDPPTEPRSSESCARGAQGLAIGKYLLESHATCVRRRGGPRARDAARIVGVGEARVHGKACSGAAQGAAFSERRRLVARS